MKKQNVSLVALAIATALGVSACGGGGSTASTTTTNPTVRGAITGFGSVYVNGVEYFTDGASFTIDGQPATEADLAVGMVVTVSGSTDGTTGQALSVDFADELQGIVQSNNFAVDGTLVVMGQTIQTGADTVFDSNDPAVITIDQIPVNAVVEVSGYTDGASGQVYATRIELKSSAWVAGEEIEVKGVIDSVDTATSTLDLNGLTVDYSAAQLEGLTAPTAGTYVQVSSTAGIVNGELVASKLELEDGGDKGIDGEEGDDVALQGIISAINGSELVVNGQTVILSSATDFNDGMTAADLAVDMQVTVEGSLDANGNILAEEVKFGIEGKLGLDGFVEAVDSTSVTIMGQQITVDATTTVSDDSDANVHYFSLADVNVGDYLKVNAAEDGNGGLKATKVERDNANVNEPSAVEGAVSSVSNSEVVITGVTVNLAQVSPAISPAVGDILQVEGQYDSGTGILAAVTAEIGD